MNQEDIKAKLSSVISNQFPDFVRDDYPKFIAFLEAYYKYLEQTDQRNLTTIIDIDRTLDEFVGEFKRSLLHNFPQYTIPGERHVLKNIRNAYTSKGTEATYKALFRIFFNKEAEFYYPSSYLLRSSDGRWQQDNSIFVEIASGDPFSAVGDIITVSGAVRNVDIFVERVVLVEGNVYEFFLQRKQYGTIEVGNIVTTPEGVLGTIVPTTVKFEIVRGGVGFRLGQIININTSFGNGTKLKVTKIDSTGAIVRAQIITFGIGYISDFYASLLPISDAYYLDVSPITVTNTTTSDGYTLPSDSQLQGFTDSGFVNNADYWADYSHGTYAGTILREFYNDTPPQDSENSAIFKFTIGAIAKYPGYYSTNDGFISDSIYIQDSKYYQAYSYVIKIDEQLKTYRNIVKSYLHPAGFALFAEYEVRNEFDISSSIQSLINLIRLALEDSVSVPDSITRISFTKSVSADLVNTLELFSLQLNRGVEDSIAGDDSGGATLLNPYVFDGNEYYYDYTEGRSTF